MREEMLGEREGGFPGAETSGTMTRDDVRCFKKGDGGERRGEGVSYWDFGGGGGSTGGGM